MQGRTYAYLFGLVERFINAKVLEISRDHWFGNQIALQALVRFSDEEIKHQELFRRIETHDRRDHAGGLPVPRRTPNAVADFVLGKSTWAVLALTASSSSSRRRTTARASRREQDVSALWKDVFMFHWKEECQHAMLDELEWQREDAKLDAGRARRRGH